MTPLHWAAYHNDVEVCKLLIENGAKQKLNSQLNMPIDIAAFCNRLDVVYYFAEVVQEELQEISN